jgi:hypothetical protein
MNLKRLCQAKLALPLWILLTAAAAVILGEYLSNQLYFQDSDFLCTGFTALGANILMLICFLALLFALMNRLLAALAAGLIAYALLFISNLLKLIHLDSPLEPLDFQYMTDLRVIAGPLLRGSMLLWVLPACACAVVLGVLAWRASSPRLSARPRILVGAVAAALLCCAFVLPSWDSVRDEIGNAGIDLPENFQFEARQAAEDNGLLVELAMEAGDSMFRQPEGYTRSKIEAIVREHEPPAAIGALRAQPKVNLIVFVVESFMDPLDLGIPFTSDPIPTFHEISRTGSGGRITVPVFGGDSANTEFELLTGLSMHFLPDWSCPYRQYMKQDIPSLPRFLRQRGYATAAVLADPPYLFNRKSVYPHLGFDRWFFLLSEPGTPRSPTQEFASDEAVADRVIALSAQGSPYFIFAFTGATHYPWDYPDYLKSSLDIVGAMAEPDRSYLKTYVNALRVTDQSLKKLIAHFEKADQRTAILVMGDHLPPFPHPGGIYEAAGFFKGSGLDLVRKRYQVPAALWCNWPAAKENLSFSANFLGIHMLKLMGLSPAGTLELDDVVSSRFPVLGRIVQTADGRSFDPDAPDLPLQSLMEEYRLIEYDLLLGKQYALRAPGWGW